MPIPLAKTLTYAIYTLHFVFLFYVLFYQGIENHTKAEADHIRSVVAEYKRTTGDKYVNPALVREAEANFRAKNKVDEYMFENAQNNTWFASASMIVAIVFLWQHMYLLATTLLIPAFWVTANYLAATGEWSAYVFLPVTAALALVALLTLVVKKSLRALTNGGE